jgi:hypothetical protein
LFDKTFTGELFDGTNTESFYYFVTQDLEARGALSLFDLDNEAMSRLGVKIVYEHGWMEKKTRSYECY